VSRREDEVAGLPTPEERPGGSAFGIVETPELEDDLFDVDEVVESEPQRQETPAQEVPERPAAERAVGDGQPEQEQRTPEQQYEDERLQQILGGKYRTWDDLQNGIDSANRLREQNYQELQRLRSQNQEMMGVFESWKPHVQRLLQDTEQQQQQYPQQILEEPDPQRQAQMMQAFIRQEADRIAQARVQEQLEPIQQQQAMQFTQQATNAIEAFRRSHPEVRPHDDTDQAIGRFIMRLRDTADPEDPDWDGYPLTQEGLEAAYRAVRNPRVESFIDELDLDPRDYIEIAEEVVQNPVLEDTVRAMPHLLDDPERGLAWARRMATYPAVAQGMDQGQAAAAAQTEASRRAAYVESGGTGAPVQQAPGTQPVDPFDEVLDYDRRLRESSIFNR
jgi:hypothetical protein